MKFPRTLLVLFFAGIAFSNCKKDNTDRQDNLPLARTANIFGFPLTRPECQLFKITEAGYTTDFFYNSDGLLEKTIKTNSSLTPDTTLFYYDAAYRLVKVLPKSSHEEWALDYAGSDLRVNKIRHQNLSSGIKDTIAVTYPASNKVVLSYFSLASATQIYTYSFDGNYNPIGMESKKIGFGGSTTINWTTQSNFSSTVINPMYTYASVDYLYFKNSIAGYESFGMLLAGKYLGTSAYIDSFGSGSNYTYTVSTDSLNANGYPLSYLFSLINGATYTFTSQAQYNCP